MSHRASSRHRDVRRPATRVHGHGAATLESRLGAPTPNAERIAARSCAAIYSRVDVDEEAAARRDVHLVLAHPPA